MRYKVALIVGRFQPFHKGHLFLVKKALQKADKIVFGIGSANIHDEYNPLNFNQRKKMLEIVIQKEKLEARVLKIVPLDDVYNDEKWLKNVREKAGRFDLVVSNSEWTNKILEKAGYKIWRLGYYRKDLYEGWRVRELIKAGKNFKNRIPAYLYPFLIFNFQFSIFNKNFKFQNSKQKSNPYSLISNSYLHSILGGTFDRLHKGHEKFISQAFEKSQRVTIGLTTEKMIRKKILWQTIESFSDRNKYLIKFLKQKGYDKRATIIPLDDIYGIGAKREKIDAVFVTEETFPGGLAINKLRQKKGWPELKIEKVDYVLAKDGKKISSERIRLGEIDRKGSNFQFSIFNFQKKEKKELILPEDLREKLRQPIGKVIKNGQLFRYINIMKYSMMIAVGDIISMELVKVGIEPDVKIIDFRSRRKPILDKSEILNSKSQINPKSEIINNKRLEFKDSNLFGASNLEFRISNDPGTINSQAVVAIKKAIDQFIKTGKKQTIVINGEEDLLALPAIMLAPLNSVVLYGQWQIGVVMIKVDEKTKKSVSELLKKFF